MYNFIALIWMLPVSALSYNMLKLFCTKYMSPCAHCTCANLCVLCRVIAFTYVCVMTHAPKCVLSHLCLTVGSVAVTLWPRWKDVSCSVCAHMHVWVTVCVCVLQQAGGKRDRLRFNSHRCHLQQLSSSHSLFRGPVFALSPSWPPFKDPPKRERAGAREGEEREGGEPMKRGKNETDHWTVEKKI